MVVGAAAVLQQQGRASIDANEHVQPPIIIKVADGEAARGKVL